MDEMNIRNMPAPLMLIEERAFSGEPVRLDNIYFKGCTFKNCDLIFSGSGLFSFVDCAITDCQFLMDGQATNTLIFLSILYKMAPELVENYFRQIKGGDLLKIMEMQADGQSN